MMTDSCASEVPAHIKVATGFSTAHKTGQTLEIQRIGPHSTPSLLKKLHEIHCRSVSEIPTWADLLCGKPRLRGSCHQCPITCFFLISSLRGALVGNPLAGISVAKYFSSIVVIDRDRFLLHEIVKQSRMWAVNM